MAGVEPLHCEFSQMKSQVCHDPVLQASWAFAETADIARGVTGEGPKDLARETHTTLCIYPIPSRLVLRLQFVATERTLSASAKGRKDGKMTE